MIRLMDRLLFRHRVERLAAVLGLAIGAGPAAAQVADAGGALEAIAPGVYAIIHADAIHAFPDGSTEWPHSNVGVIVGSRCVLVVDSDFYPSRAAADIELIRKVTSRPVCFLVNTHWHGDHTHGNGVYRARFPKLEIVGTEETRGFIAVNQARFPHRVVMEGSAPRQTLEVLRGFKASGKDSSGTTLTDERRALLDRVIGELETQIREFGTVEVAAPTRIFAGQTTIDLGGIAVQIKSRGRANSPDDLTIAVPARGVLFTGDIVVHPVPYAFGVHPTRWTKVLAAIEREHPRVIVPGHGPVMHDLGYVTQMRELLDTVLARVTALAIQGRSLAEITREIRLDDLRARWVRPGDVNTEVYWNDSIAGPLIESTYQCVIGSRC